MRSNIKCDAEKCMHNCDGLCDAAVVHVRDGKGNSQSARCTTYAYRISNSGSRLIEKTTNVKADATRGC